MQRQRENFPILLRLNYHKMITKLVLKNVIDETEVSWRDLWKCCVLIFSFAVVDSDYATMKIFCGEMFPTLFFSVKRFRNRIKILLTFKAAARTPMCNLYPTSGFRTLVVWKVNTVWLLNRILCLHKQQLKVSIQVNLKAFLPIFCMISNPSLSVGNKKILFHRDTTSKQPHDRSFHEFRSKAQK